MAEDWSPDGRWLAGVSSQGGIVFYSLDSRTYTTLPDAGSFPSWLSDSRRLLFNGANGITAVDRESRAVRVVQRTPGPGVQVIGLSRDSRRAYLLRVLAQGDIWMATLRPSPAP